MDFPIKNGDFPWIFPLKKGDFPWIFPLKMVIFHSYVNVYQRVPSPTPPGHIAMAIGGFQSQTSLTPAAGSIFAGMFSVQAAGGVG